MGKRELAEAEILVAEEKLMAFKDDYKAQSKGDGSYAVNLWVFVIGFKVFISHSVAPSELGLSMLWQ